MTTFRQPPSRHFPVIRVFVSSTFSDLVAERNALAEKVWPELERYCRQRGFTFQAIDLRWGVPSEAGLDHRTMQICFEELRRAQEASPEPNFLLLLGDKYGWRPLPETISESEYARLREHAKSSEEQGTLADWYRRDRNAIPPHHLLRARADSPDGRDYTRVPDDEGCLRDTDAWLAVQEKLWTIVNRAYPVSLLAERFAEGTDDMPASVHFQGSATEQEIWHGALQVQNPRESVVAWFREIDRTGGDPDPSQLKRFLDLRPDQSPEPDAASALATLKQQVEEKLRPDPVLRARCRWARDADGALTGEVTSDHLAPMCETILMRLRALILRQINDYWGSDLSAEDATVGVVRGTQHELDLELRDHHRFAQERGPVDGFVGRDEQVRSIRDYLQGSTNRPLLVHGPSGSGKTALLAYVSQQPFLPGTESGGVSPLILTRFIGTHPESSTLRGLMSSLCRELRVYFPVTVTEKSPDGHEHTVPAPLPDTLQKLIEEFYAQLGHSTAEQPIFVILDALDQLETADQARECFWLRSQILPQLGASPCRAGIVASCLSPSLEFPLESEACEPFRRLQARGLVADDELGALDEAAACDLLRGWLSDRQRGLTPDQWTHVEASLRDSSARRQPFYLKVLHEQLRGWREFDEPAPLPASLPLLIQETLERLCLPNQHGQLPRIAISYLVSARYGLSEGEMLDVLFLDPEMQAQLEAAGKAYGHRLPPKADRHPIAPWARLRSDLRAYLSERAAPGTTVLSCYHRQVEQAVRTLFLTEESNRAECQRLLADYFDARWDQPDAHALMELPDLLLALPDHRRLYDRLTDFSFPMRKAEVGLLETIPDDYARLGKEGPAHLGAQLRTWQDFFREHGHILRRGMADRTIHKILLQLALEHADDSLLTIAAETWLSAERCNWMRLQRMPRLVHRTPNSCLAVLEGHTQGVRGALLLMDGRILTWSGDGLFNDNALWLWDAITGGFLALLEGHTGSICDVRLLSDGRILSWADDETLRVWDSVTLTCLGVLKGHIAKIEEALVLSDGKILSWSLDKTLRLWDPVSGVCFAVLEGHRRALLLPDGRILSWGADETLRVWDAETGDCLAVLEGHTGYVIGALALPDGRILSWDWTLRVWDAETGDCLAVLEGHTHYVKIALELPNGTILSWSDHEKKLRVWDAVTGTCIAILEGHTGVILGVLPLPDGRILSWAEDTTLRIWETTTGACLAVLQGHTDLVTNALALPNGRILSCSGDGTLRVWDATNEPCLAILEGHRALVIPDGRIISWGGGTLRVWDAVTWTCLAVLEGHAGNVGGVLPLPYGRILSWSDDGTLRLWDAAFVTDREVLQGHSGKIEGVLSLSDGKILTWSRDNTLRLWDAVSGACLSILTGHTDWVADALAVPDGRIASWSNDRTFRLWDAETGACLTVLHRPELIVDAVVALPDGRILSWSIDGTLRLWDAATSECRAVLEGHTGGVEGVLPLPDGRILSWSKDQTLRVWDAAIGTCIAPSMWSVVRGMVSRLWTTPGAWRAALKEWTAPRAWRTALMANQVDVQDALALPDGRILSWAEDWTLRLWDAATLTSLAVLEEHQINRSLLAHRLPRHSRLLALLEERTMEMWKRCWPVTRACSAVLEGHTRDVKGALVLSDGRILSWADDCTLRVWDATTGDCLAVLEGHTNIGLRAVVLPDGQILSWSWDNTLRLWSAATGYCLAIVEKINYVVSALALPDGRILSWSEDKLLRLWDTAHGGNMELIPLSDFPARHPELFHHTQSVEQPESVAGDWAADATGRTARLFHRLGFTPLPVWQAESNCEARLLQPDGTLVVTQDNGQVCFLKLHHGNRRVSLAEAEELLLSGNIKLGASPQVIKGLSD